MNCAGSRRLVDSHSNRHDDAAIAHTVWRSELMRPTVIVLCSLIDLGGGSQAAVLGTGRLGVVLSNQSDQNLCGWLPFAKTLATRGFRALVYDYDTAADPAGTGPSGAKVRSMVIGFLSKQAHSP
jgi:hypothetical protein